LTECGGFGTAARSGTQGGLGRLQEAEPVGMVNVLLVGNPFKVFSLVVGLIAIDVVYKWLVVRVGNPSLRNDAVKAHIDSLSTCIQTHILVPLVAVWACSAHFERLQDSSFAPGRHSVGIDDGTIERSDSATIADLVSRVPYHRDPNLIRFGLVVIRNGCGGKCLLVHGV